MSDPKINGHAPSVPPITAGNPSQLVTNKSIDDIIGPIIGNGINGLMITVQGVPAEILVPAVARVTAKLLANAVAGNPLTVLFQMRAAIKREFETGLASVHVPANQAAPAAAPPNKN